MIFTDTTAVPSQPNREWRISLPQTKEQLFGFGSKVIEEIFLDRLAGLPDSVILPKVLASIAQVNVEGGLTQPQILNDILKMYALNRANILTVNEVNKNGGQEITDPMHFPAAFSGAREVFLRNFGVVRTGLDTELRAWANLPSNASSPANNLVTTYLVSRAPQLPVQPK